MECVKCGAELTGSETECLSCGVIISKARVGSASPPRPPVGGAEDVSAPIGARNYHYRVAPFHGRIRAGQGIEQVSSQLQDLINQYAAYGWEFVQVATVSLTINQGCLAGLLGSGSTQHSYNQVVFRYPAVNERESG